MRAIELAAGQAEGGNGGIADLGAVPVQRNVVVVRLLGRRSVGINIKADTNRTGKARLFRKVWSRAVRAINRGAQQREAHSIGRRASGRRHDAEVKRCDHGGESAGRSLIKGDDSQFATRLRDQTEIVAG